ncbi:hypothetical protein FI667_g5168, partial [Globisporangium splendens]
MPQTPRTRQALAHHHHASNSSSINEALLAAAHAKRSIYENTRMSGEQKFRHKLPINVYAEKSDRCSDATDSLYANSLVNLMKTSRSSRL